jgi:hypothetical protein
MDNVWTGSFKSDKYPVYGNIKICLKPLDVWGYKTRAKIYFKGFASVVQNIFMPNMELDLHVQKNMCFKIKIGEAEATLNLESIPKPSDTYIAGKYHVVKGSYDSTGDFYLMLGDNNYEQGGCSIM